LAGEEVANNDTEKQGAPEAHRSSGHKSPEKKTEAEMKQAVRDVRDEVVKAKEAMELILTFLERTCSGDDSKLKIWSDDVRGAYLSTDAAWQMLWLVSEGNKDDSADRCKRFKAEARGRLECALSELDSFNDSEDEPEARHLKSMFGFACKRSLDAMDELLKEMVPTAPEPPAVAPAKRVVVKGPKEIELLCQVCGKVSMSFGMGELLGDQVYLFSGTTKRAPLDETKIDEILEHLRKDDIATAHKLAWDLSWSMEDGLDGYCPDCDKIYCHEHIQMQVVWDEGYYDYTWGTCPEGHKRVIDD
jgi:hypothetical protein